MVSSLALITLSDALARDRHERWEDRRTARRAYVAGAIAQHRREEWRERRDDRWERRERRERREDRRDAARAAIAVGVGAAIVGGALRGGDR
jgi:uncharacterized membrane protein YccC